jgi:hypothetical protein
MKYHDPLTESEQTNIFEYEAQLHRVQTAIAFGADSHMLTPKQMRVGIDSAHVSHAALVELLVDKGIIERADFFAALRKAAEREGDRWEKSLQEHLGTPRAKTL